LLRPNRQTSWHVARFFKPRGREVIAVQLTDDGKRQRLKWARPEHVVMVLARPAGLEPTAFCSGGRRSIR
jgi:hypothetical protein